jgi:hypothetical protein
MKIYLVAALCVFAIACGNSETEVPKDAPVKKSYFPISEYIKGEIRTIDSLPVGIMKKVVTANRKDSAFIERSEFHNLATAFTGSALDKRELEAKYTEHSFMDQTTGYYTFTYEPSVADAPFQRVDVLVKPGATFDNVKSIYIERSSSENDTAINERLYWKANISFTITKEKKYKNQPPVVEQLLVIWDPSAY